MPSAAEYVDALLARGQYSFTTHDAMCALGASLAATRAALRRLKQKKLVAAPYRGFHVVVPPQYRRLGCLPADQFIAELMEHLEEPYYVALLSAAAYHGAAHRAPMVFQVVVPEARRSLECGSVRVQFVARQDMEATPTVERNTATCVLRIASPEASAIELVGYPRRCGFPPQRRDGAGRAGRGDAPRAAGRGGAPGAARLGATTRLPPLPRGG